MATPLTSSVTAGRRPTLPLCAAVALLCCCIALWVRFAPDGVDSSARRLQSDVDGSGSDRQNMPPGRRNYRFMTSQPSRLPRLASGFRVVGTYPHDKDAFT